MKGIRNSMVLGLCLLVFAANADARGGMCNKGSHNAPPGLSAVVTNLPAQELSTEEKAGLARMREEEKLARDVYQALYEQWGQKIFSNIARSEQRHMDAVKSLLDKYGMIDPVGDSPRGVFTDPVIGKLYAELVEKGMTSLMDAFSVGAAIEDLDIRDLYDNLKRTDNSDIKVLYENLAKGSRNHLRAFNHQLSLNGAAYEARYLNAVEISEITSSPKERGRIDENGLQAAGPGKRAAGKGKAAKTARFNSAGTDDGLRGHKGVQTADAGKRKGQGKGAGNRGNGSCFQ